MSDDDYKVGYKRPPKGTRWKKGQSGNRRGRAKGQLNLKTELLQELSEIVSIREDGKPKKVTKLRAFLKGLTRDAIHSERNARDLLASTIVRVLGPGGPAEEPSHIVENDLAIVQGFIKRKSPPEGGEK
jgi:Family of unknown function (DUF5681)